MDLGRPAVTDKLETLLGAMRNAAPDHSLASAAVDVRLRIAETASARIQTWRVRVAAMLLVIASGVAASATTAAVAAPEASPFAAWSSLAPSTLLELAE
jgi:hypothetical protein